MGKKGKNAVKRKKTSEANRSLISFFAFFPHSPCMLLTARHRQDHTPAKPAPFLDEKQGSWLQEVPGVVEKVINSADQRVLQLLIWSLLPAKDVHVQIFPQPAKACFYWFTRFWTSKSVARFKITRKKIKEEGREGERVLSLSLPTTSSCCLSCSRPRFQCPVPTIWTPGAD